MVSELRCLRFTKSEVEAILRLGVPRLAKALPPGRLTCFRANRDGFQFRFDRTDLLHLTPAECFSAMLWYCQGQGIPMSRRLPKRIEVRRDTMVLVLGEMAAVIAPADILGPPPGDGRCAACRERDEPCRFDTGAAVDELEVRAAAE